MTLDELDLAIEQLRIELEKAGRSIDDGFRLLLGMPHHGDPSEIQEYIHQVSERGVTEFTFGLSLSRSKMKQQLETYARIFI
jgi:hypothetical protein